MKEKTKRKKTIKMDPKARPVEIIKQCCLCNQDPINSHSITRGEVLKVLQKNNHVYSLDHFDDQNILVAKNIENVTTTYNFCRQHDTLFFPIENRYTFDRNNPMHLFLHSFRTFQSRVHKYREYKKDAEDQLKTIDIKDKILESYFELQNSNPEQANRIKDEIIDKRRTRITKIYLV